MPPPPLPTQDLNLGIEWLQMCQQFGMRDLGWCVRSALNDIGLYCDAH